MMEHDEYQRLESRIEYLTNCMTSPWIDDNSWSMIELLKVLSEAVLHLAKNQQDPPDPRPLDTDG